MSNKYKIMNRITHDTVEIEADSAQQACEVMGWMIGDCYVKCLWVDPNPKRLSEDEEG